MKCYLLLILLLSDRNSTTEIHQKEKCKNLDGRLPINLGIFVDHALFKMFLEESSNGSTIPEMEAKVKKYILGLVKNAQLMLDSDESLQPSIQLRVTYFEMWTAHGKTWAEMRSRRLNMVYYMENFCIYQTRKQLKSQSSWAHAFLFTGFDLASLNRTDVTGYSTVGTICTPFSCSVTEGRNFKASHTIIHELGHALGMVHDGAGNNCSNNCCFMSPLVGAGEQKWSKCSKESFKEKVNKLCKERNWCFERPVKEEQLWAKTEMPGQVYTLIEQCRRYWGLSYSPFFLSGFAHPPNVCRKVWCTNRTGKIKVSHPALEGTYCSENKWCRRGQCSKADQKLKRRNGAWSSWGLAEDSQQCGDLKSPCEIQGQIQLRMKLRICNNPNPTNGGSYCPGSQYKGEVCSNSTLCNGSTAEDFAGKVCRSIQQTRAEHPEVAEFTGEGIQRWGAASDDACLVWCCLANSSHVYTFFDLFPDGSSCGYQSFCLAGKCMSLSCVGKEITEETAACGKEETTKIETTELTTASTSTTTELQKPSWTAWGSWSPCSKSCGSFSFKKQSRRCMAGREKTPKGCPGKFVIYRICSGLGSCKSFNS